MLKRLWSDTGANALAEFALSLPVVFFLGMAGIEYANYGRVQLLVSQVALNLADNASRVGLSSGLAVTQLRESDLNAVLAGARLQATGIGLTTHGRITLSSLENVQQSYDSAPVQRIHWQRCLGEKGGTGYDSTYGVAGITAGTLATLAYAGTTIASGMGDTNYKVNASAGTGVMFVEVNYQYQPVFGTLYIGQGIIHSTASFVVRDNRDFTQIFNPSPIASLSTCNLYSAI